VNGERVPYLSRKGNSSGVQNDQGQINSLKVRVYDHGMGQRYSFRLGQKYMLLKRVLVGIIKWAVTEGMFCFTSQLPD
jgi:hypothetical protein